MRRPEFVFRRSYHGPLKAVLLDWAGTTMDYGCMAPAVVFMDVFKRKGVEITMNEAREPMGAHKKVHIRQISKNESVSERWRETHGRKPNEEDVESMFRDFIPLQLKCLAQYADLVPGTLETTAQIRSRGLKIGSTTGYTEEMMGLLQSEAKRRGYEPDATVCATQVPAGRPHPFMCLQNAILLQTYPLEAFVKIGDTLPDIEEGLNAGMWTIGLAKPAMRWDLLRTKSTRWIRNLLFLLRRQATVERQRAARSGTCCVCTGLLARGRRDVGGNGSARIRPLR